MIVIDLLKEKDSGFIGAIGELVAWKYLWRHKGIFCRGFGTRVSFAGTWTGKSEYDLKRLTNEQASYLRDCLSCSTERRYDFIGHDKHNFIPIYLIEVKTTRLRELHNTTGRKKTEEIMKAKSLKFKPLIIHVQFLNNWKFKVICRQL